MPMNDLIKAAMEANNEKRRKDAQEAYNAPGGQGERDKRHNEDRLRREYREATDNSPSGYIERLRKQIEVAKRRIMDLRVQASRNPEKRGEYQAQIEFAEERLAKLEESWDKIHGTGRYERNQKRNEERDTARQEKAARGSESSGGGEPRGGRVEQEGGEETGPGGMTEERWGGMSRQDRQAFLGRLGGSPTGGSGGPPTVGPDGRVVPNASRPWWMTLDYGGEGNNELGAKSTAGMGGGGSQHVPEWQTGGNYIGRP